MSELYPLKFEPILKEKMWGGTSLVNRYHKKGNPSAKYGESWEISAVSGNRSVVSNGFLAGNNIEELIEVYMGDLVGDAVFDKFGNEFPLLIKLIEAREDLSVQVHPGNELAARRHKAYGKTEMWYILEADEGARIYSGFRETVSKETYIRAVNDSTLPGLLNLEYTSPGKAYFTPAGRVHAIGAGNILAEIQQTSDVTYRIYDWGRNGSDGKPRDLHTDLALDAIDFDGKGSGRIDRMLSLNRTENLVNCEFFTANVIDFNENIDKDYNFTESFVIFICTEGEFLIRWEGSSEPVIMGETVLLPAMIREITLEPSPRARILEVFIAERIKYPKLNN